MPDSNDLRLPGVPAAESVRAYVSVPDADRVVPDLSTLVAGPTETSIESLLLGPGTVPATVVGYAAAGDMGTAAVEAEIREWAADLDAGKISKLDSFYAPQTPVPPVVWEYVCSTCRFYEPADGDATAAPQCAVVGQEGDPFGGEEIHPDGWCALWMPLEGRGFFEWFTDRVESLPDA